MGMALKFDMHRRTALIGLLGAAIVAIPASIAQSSDDIFDVTGPRFGADPSGRRNSTLAFAAASEALARAGGGTILVPPGNYLVGMQKLTGKSSSAWAFEPAPIITVNNARRPVRIIGTGARLIAAAGLRFGSFDPKSGKVVRPNLPFMDRAFRATPYRAMIELRNNKAPVSVSGFDLDGNLAGLEIGGDWNDQGIQISGSGIEAYDNHSLTIENVICRNHPLDGIMIGWDDLRTGRPAMPHILANCSFDGNGRQGLSWVGGNMLTAKSCKFLRTGRGGLTSAPGAGMDIEAENAICRNGRFEDCTFSDNAGVGMLIHRESDVANISFINCSFVGTSHWAAWPAAPGVSFDNCMFVGGVTNAYANQNKSLATLFRNCRFTADPAMSPRGQVYSQNYLTVEMDAIQNVRFDKCQFDSGPSRAKGLIFTNGGCEFVGCRFDQQGTGLAVLRGKFTGRNIVSTRGQTNFSGATFADPVLVNGSRVG